MRQPHSTFLFFVVTLTSLQLLFAACDDEPTEPEKRVRNDTHKVAVYADRGTDLDCVRASTKMFEWMGYEVTHVTAPFVIGSGLNDFSIVCVPGGDMYIYSYDLGSKGVENIRKFVNNGGAYVGICGGAYFTAEKVIWQGNVIDMKPLSFFPATAAGPLNTICQYPQICMCEVDFGTPKHPIAQSLPDSSWILYAWGPAFSLRLTEGISVVAKYAVGGKACALARDFGKGRVFAIGTHPEIEEDSDRDGTDMGQSLDDVGSDWDLMKNAVRWCPRQ